MFSYPT